jgi:hypothetical protein
MKRTNRLLLKRRHFGIGETQPEALTTSDTLNDTTETSITIIIIIVIMAFIIIIITINSIQTIIALIVVINTNHTIRAKAINSSHTRLQSLL